MNERITNNKLYDCYSGLLTKEEQDCYQLYCWNDQSLSEIAETKGISRTAIHKRIKTIIQKLNHYEEVLKLSEKHRRLSELASGIESENLKTSILEIENL